MSKNFVSKWLLNSRTGQLEQEIDQIRSQYPPTVASGYWAWGSGSVGRTSILNVPSACRFHLQFIWIDNQEAAKNYVFFWDGPGTSVPVGGVQVASSTTEFITVGPGVVFASGVHASVATSMIGVRVGGLLRESGPE
jgi:hypothetical protein